MEGGGRSRRYCSLNLDTEELDVENSRYDNNNNNNSSSSSSSSSGENSLEFVSSGWSGLRI